MSKPRGNKGSYKRSTNKVGGNKTDMRPKSAGFKVEKEEPKKDSKSSRVNFPNERTSRFVRNFVKDMEQGTQSGNNNDISTWNKNAEYMRSAGSLPFAEILGEPLTEFGNSQAVPGICVLSWSPSIGTGEEPVAVNKCFQAIYDFMTHANSRDYKFDFPDVAMYSIAGANVFMAIEEAKRVYGICKGYTEQNRYNVDNVLQSIGWDPEDVHSNLNDMWFGLNDLIIQTRQIWIPSTIPVFKRWIDLNSHLYLDAPGKRAQIYALKCINYWELSEVGMDTGTCLCPVVYPQTATYNGVSYEFSEFTTLAGFNGLRKWKNFKWMIQRMINKLVASQDRGALYGDILQAYGANNIMAMTEFSAEYSVVPEYNAMVLAQFENAVASSAIQMYIIQDPKAVLTIEPVFGIRNTPVLPTSTTFISGTNADTLAGAFGVPVNQILNFHGDSQPTPEWIMEATRFKSSPTTTWTVHTVSLPVLNTTEIGQPWGKGTVKTTTETWLVPSQAGTEIVNSIEIFTRVPGTTGMTLETSQVTQLNRGAISSPTPLKMMAFDWHPFIYAISFNMTSSGTYNIPVSGFDNAYGDYDNYLVLSSSELSKLHKVAIYSGFNLPMNAS